MSPGGGMSTCSRARKTRGRTRAGSAGRSCRPNIASPGSRRESRNPRRGAAQGARGEAMDDVGRERRRRRDEDEDEQAVIGTAALRDRHDRQPGQARLRRHAAPSSACVTGARASISSPGRMPASRHRPASTAIARERQAVGLAGVSAAAGLRGRPRKAMPNALTKQAAASAAASASSAPTAGTMSLSPHCGRLRAEQDRLEHQPFGDESVERRQRRNRGAADEEGEARLRHAVDQPAELFHVALAGRVQHGAGAEKQQAFEQRVVEHMEQRRRQRRAPRRRPSRWPGMRGRGRGRRR